MGKDTMGINRRTALGLVGGTLAWPLAFPLVAHAQRIPTVGVLMAGEERAPDNQTRIAAFRKGFAEQGWKDGENVRLVVRWSAGKSELISQYAKELVALTPDVILANSTPVISAFHRLTTSVPVVFALAMDPIGLGQVQSLAHPGGNFTGFTFIDPELIGKWMGLLKDVAPATTRAALLFNPATSPAYHKFVKELTAVRRPGAIELSTMAVATTGEMENAIAALAQKPGGSLLVGPDPFNQVRLPQIAKLAAQHRLPVVSVYRPYITAGGLIAYGPDTADVFRRSANYVDRILKGAKPADLPVQQPSKFELIINLKTAKALGLEVPSRLLFTADEVIE
jgi:putative ABC transport system substrate-binding protein